MIEEITIHLATLPYVEKVILYGSRARGDHEERSDIDLAVLCPNATKKQWTEIWFYIDEAPTLYSIDIVRLDEVNRELQENVKNEGVVLYERSKS
ncbi:MAG: nucleotidyltransferase domain-containing protein [Magnetococcales bacterium]|nr:nucleotidyltransferase domain-containing protein [Magnetococcales bacterium]